MSQVHFSLSSFRNCRFEMRVQFEAKKKGLLNICHSHTYCCFKKLQHLSPQPWLLNIAQVICPKLCFFMLDVLIFNIHWSYNTFNFATHCFNKTLWFCPNFMFSHIFLHNNKVFLFFLKSLILLLNTFPS